MTDYISQEMPCTSQVCVSQDRICIKFSALYKSGNDLRQKMIGKRLEMTCTSQGMICQSQVCI